MDHLGRKAVVGLFVGVAVLLTSASAWGKQTQDTKPKIAAYRHAANEARVKAVFHQTQAKNSKDQTRRQRRTLRYHLNQADYYRKLADKLELAANNLERVSR